MAHKILDAIKAAGVVGAGGAGFPTHVKADAQVDTVIANGSECEPMLYSDQSLMEQHPREILGGLQLLMETTGASRGIIALKEKYTTQVKQFQELCAKDDSLSVKTLGNFYPSGDEQSMVYETTGRIVPEGGIPLNVGVVVDNVETLYNIFHATMGEPVTHRTVTVTGSVKSPGVYRFPIGTLVWKAVEIAGGATEDEPAVIDGGPMMGAVSFDLNGTIQKTTSGLIVLPNDHHHVQRRTMPTNMEMIRSISMCCQCRECTDLCPRYQLGHDLEPHKVMRAIITRSPDPSYQITQAHICCLCGICETIACPLGLSPRNVFAQLKTQLREQGVANPHHRAPENVRVSYDYTKIPKDRVLARCGLTEYHSHPPYRGESPAIDRVEIALQQHIGVPAKPVVAVDQKVAVGDIIAQTPEGKLGALIHASINGVVTQVSNKRIVIEG